MSIQDQQVAVDYDNKGQMERIAERLVPGETLQAVYDMKGGGTGFLGLTSKRLIIQDEGAWRKKRSLVSVPYAHVAMVATAADEKLLGRSTSEMTVATSGGQTFGFEFRAGDKAERAYNIIVTHIN